MSTAAHEIQAARDQANLRSHRERIVWLSKNAPRWSCGELVDAHSRHVLMLQSRTAVASAERAL